MARNKNLRSAEKAGGYISKLTFNNGKELEIAANDIVVFVGPNNAGKSQSLKDIYALSKAKMPSVVISDVKISKYTQAISTILSQVSVGEKYDGYTKYDYLGKNLVV